VRLSTGKSADTIHIVAVFDAAKGALVLLAGFGVLVLVHKDLHAIAEQIVRHMHLNPARHYPTIFLDLSSRVTDFELWGLALSAILYSLVRFVEAYGLWLHRQWAEWFGFLTGGMYIPVELFELFRGMTTVKVAILGVNAMVVFFLGKALYGSRRQNE
jgi:uncharacterized membrane protein (DUF2068 family)